MNGNRNNIVFFDVDNTILEGYTQKYFIQYLFRIKEVNVIVLFLSYIWFLFYKLHIVTNIEKAINFYISFLRGWDKNRLYSLVDNFFEICIRKKIYNEAIKLINDYKINGFSVILISTSLEPIVNKLANYLKIDKYISSELEIKDGIYTGKIKGRAVVGDEKLRLAKNLLENYDKKDVKTYFYSDHFSDESLLSFVDIPIVVNPDKVLYNKAKSRGWEIISIK